MLIVFSQLQMKQLLVLLSAHNNIHNSPVHRTARNYGATGCR